MKNSTAKRYHLYVAFLLFTGTIYPVFAADIEVTGFTDGTDPCVDTTSPVSCPSLRSAVIYANNTSGADTVNLKAGEYMLSIGGVDETWTGTGTTNDPYVPSITPDATKGDLDITDSVTINGATDGSNILLTTIRWSQQSTTDPTVGDRIFHVQALTGGDPVSVSFSHLILTNGSVGIVPNTDPAASNPYDIEVVNNAPGTAVIRQFRRMGGAVAVGSGAAVVVYQQTVNGPGADPGDGSPLGPFPGGPSDPDIAGVIEGVNFNRVVVTGNFSGADGGGIFSTAPLTIDQSDISGNTSGTNGGGIYTEAALMMSETTVGSAGSIPFLSNASLTANGNQAVNGGGLFDTGVHTTTINRSSINNNTASSYGGAIMGHGQVGMNINNSTISGNLAVIGAGISSNGPSTIKSSTISYNDNSVNTGGAGVNTYGTGTFTLGNTILSINTLPNGEFANCDCGHGNTNCPQIISLGYNLESCLSCAFSGTDQSDTYPLLKPLANNGGLTETHALPHTAAGDTADSPAVDTGDPDNCPGADQRGVVRPADGNKDGVFVCDVGAFELTTATADLNIATITASSETPGLNETVTVTAVIENPASAAAAAENVTVTAVVPAGFNMVNAKLNDGTTDTSCTVNATAVSCPVLTSMAPGQQATLTINANTAAEGTHTINVSVTSTADPVAENNNASLAITAIGTSDISLSTSADRTDVMAGSNVIVTLTVANNGPNNATGLRFAGSVPNGFRVVSMTPDVGTCNNTNGNMSCNADTLAASASTKVIVVLTALKAGTFNFGGEVTADQNDNNLANNNAMLSVTVTANTSSKPGTSSSGGGGGSAYILTLALLLYAIYVIRRKRIALRGNNE